MMLPCSKVSVSTLSSYLDPIRIVDEYTTPFTQSQSWQSWTLYKVARFECPRSHIEGQASLKRYRVQQAQAEEIYWNNN
jgi:hypothetical protein